MKISMPPLHKSTKSRLKQWVEQPSHGILLVGHANHNQAEVAMWLSEKLKANKSDNVHIIDSPDKSIGIDQMRKVRLIAKQHKAENQKDIFVIGEGHKITDEAQNSLLKIIEEPPSGTYFIIATPQSEKILPTIRSRMVQLEVLPLDQSSADNWHLTRGKVSDSSFDKDTIDLAKAFISAPAYIRLQRVNSLIKDKDALLNLVESLLPIYDYLIRNSAQKSDHNQLKIYTKKQDLVLETLRLLETNTNPKAIMSHLCTAL